MSICCQQPWGSQTSSKVKVIGQGQKCKKSSFQSGIRKGGPRSRSRGSNVKVTDVKIKGQGRRPRPKCNISIFNVLSEARVTKV